MTVKFQDDKGYLEVDLNTGITGVGIDRKKRLYVYKSYNAYNASVNDRTIADRLTVFAVTSNYDGELTPNGYTIQTKPLLTVKNLTQLAYEYIQIRYNLVPTTLDLNLVMNSMMYLLTDHYSKTEMFSDLDKFLPKAVFKRRQSQKMLKKQPWHQLELVR